MKVNGNEVAFTDVGPKIHNAPPSCSSWQLGFAT